jgi:hypothetical protein
MAKFACLLFVLIASIGVFANEARASSWRSATDTELKALIPARAQVIQERIETELRTASGITDGKGKYVASVVLITAGYSAEGKYSHYFIAQVPVKVGDVQLNIGDYLIGWKHNEDSLTVNFYEAASGKFVGSVEAVKNPSITGVASFRIWPPGEKSLIQVGRFTFPYQVAK